MMLRGYQIKPNKLNLLNQFHQMMLVGYYLNTTQLNLLEILVKPT
jgi:hypothetical protein